ncbi:hypothetical protein SAV14893_095090 [Streptomyces avermitilis]|uniref:Uncharacterized protein n=1 Tax=Streptomyces avermitilis TaxID=33903 RepID=A0A4D4ME74_STRAX|nr:hypothetical protein SAV14893_095090 [Streptomyces avermitilis]
MHGDGGVSVADQARQCLQRGPLRGESGVGETLEEQAQRGGDFETGQRGAEAEVDAVSEGEVFLAGAGGVEAVGVLMPGGVAVGAA